MPVNRVAAFSDGVFAIIITIIVLGMSFPSNYDVASILNFSWDIFVFLEAGLMIGAYWYVQSRLLDGLERISVKGGLITVIYLLELAIIPLFTKGIMENPDATFPALGFAIVILLSNIIYHFMQREIQNQQAITFNRNLAIFVTISTIIIGIISFFAPRAAVVLLIIFPIARWYILLKMPKELTQ